jgi:hypothetical protein
LENKCVVIRDKEATMPDNKTEPIDKDVMGFLHAIPDQQRREDCLALVALMREATGEPPRMWGGPIVGFGQYHYRYASGREGDWFLAGFSPRKQNLTIYVMAGFDRYDELLASLGKHTTDKSCLYIKRLADVDQPTLKELVRQSAAHIAATNP